MIQIRLNPMLDFILPKCNIVSETNFQSYKVNTMRFLKWANLWTYREGKKIKISTPKEVVTFDDLQRNEFSDNRPQNIQQVFMTFSFKNYDSLLLFLQNYNHSELSNDSIRNNQYENFSGRSRHTASESDTLSGNKPTKVSTYSYRIRKIALTIR